MSTAHEPTQATTAEDEASPPTPTRPPARPLPGHGMLTTIGEMVRFGGQGVIGMPSAIRLYPTEIIRLAAELVFSSGIVVWIFTGAIGAEAGLLAVWLLGGLGAGDYAGLFIAIAAVQAVSATAFGWIFSAKVGCGYTAEIGTARISEEIDALAVMGFQPRVYLVSTRLAAIVLVIPCLFMVALATMLIGAWVMIIPVLEAVSPGGYNDVLWSFFTAQGVIIAVCWAFVSALSIGVVSCYFGYHASGGPVGVGQATARSMLVNMVLVSVYCAVFYQLFFGTNVQLPIAN